MYILVGGKGSFSMIQTNRKLEFQVPLCWESCSLASEQVCNLSKARSWYICQKSCVWRRAVGRSCPQEISPLYHSHSPLRVTCFNSTAVFSAVPLDGTFEPLGWLSLKEILVIHQSPVIVWYSGFRSEIWLYLGQLCVGISPCDLGIEGPPPNHLVICRWSCMCHPIHHLDTSTPHCLGHLSLIVL